MIERICDRAIDWCIAHQGYDPDKKEIYSFGAELVLSSAVTQIVLFIVAAIIGKIPESFVYLAVSIPLRTYGGGWHAPKHYVCTITQCATFLSVVAAATFVPDQLRVITATLCMASTLALIFFRVPVEHPNNPLTPEARAKARPICLILGIVFIILSGSLFLLGQTYWGSVIAYGATTSAISYIVPSSRKGGVEIEKANRREIA